MNNAEKFKQIFELYATELWAKPESEFLTWLNAEYKIPKLPSYAKWFTCRKYEMDYEDWRKIDELAKSTRN